MIRKVHSFWHPEPIMAALPPLEGTHKADVVVVGGGVAGLSCAYYLSLAGASVTLLEKEAIGSQSATRNFGALTAVYPFAKGPQETHQALARFSRTALPRLKDLLAQEGIDCDLRDGRTWNIMRDKYDAERVRKAVEELQALGYDTHEVGVDGITDVTRRGVPGGFYTNEAVVNPFKLVDGLRQALIHRGVRIHENTPVLQIKDGMSSATVVTPAGTVEAGKVVVTVNAFASSLGLDKAVGLALPAQIFALATRRLPPSVTEQIGPCSGETATDAAERTDHRLFWQRLMPDGRLIFGGGAVRLPSSEELYTPVLTAHKMSALLKELQVRYPVLSSDDIDLCWGGTIAGPVGARPIIDHLPGARSVIFATVCLGRGVLMGTSTGVLVRELIQPGGLSSDGKDYLRYCGIQSDFASRAEESIYRVLQTGPARSLVNALMRGK